MNPDESMAVLDDSAIARLNRIGGAALVSQMIALFLQHGPERMTQAESGYAASDLRMVEHAAHSLKSSAGNVGAVRLQQAATSVEAASENDGDSVALGNLVRTLRAEYDAAAAALAVKLAENS